MNKFFVFSISLISFYNECSIRNEASARRKLFYIVGFSHQAYGQAFTRTANLRRKQPARADARVNEIAFN